MFQIGAIGLVKSIKRFDNQYNVKLSTFAVPYIIGEIKRYLRDDGMVKVSRSLKELNIKIEMLRKQYEKLGKELPGKVAVKVHSGEEGNQNYLHPEFMKKIVNY